jgi:hypothetical protein
MSTADQAAPRRDINTILAEHDDALLAVPGVVGVCVAQLADGQTPCLKVLLARRDPAQARAIPRTIEGYRVITELTGPIKPLGQ